MKNPLQSRLIASDVRIKFGVGPFEIRLGDHARGSVARSGDEHCVQVVLLDRAVQVDVDEVQARCRTPMAQKPRLDMLRLERLFEQRIGIKIDLTDGQVIGSPPVSIHFCVAVRRKVAYSCLELQVSMLECSA